MNRSSTQKLLAGGAVALAAAGGGAAVAARGNGGPTHAAAPPASFAAYGYANHGPRGGHGDFLAAVTSYLGLTADQIRTQLQSGKTLAQIADATPGKSAGGLVDALVAAARQELAAAVSAGKLTQAQADQISANLEQRITAFVNGTAPKRGPGFGGHGFGFGHGDDVAAAASYLGLTTAQLQTQLQSGKTFAQIADATPGKSASGLVDALVAHEKQELAAAVSAGKLTQAQADQISATLQRRFTDLVDGTFPKAGPRGGFRADGFRQHGFRINA